MHSEGECMLTSNQIRSPDYKKHPSITLYLWNKLGSHSAGITTYIEVVVGYRLKDGGDSSIQLLRQTLRLDGLNLQPDRHTTRKRERSTVRRFVSVDSLISELTDLPDGSILSFNSSNLSWQLLSLEIYCFLWFFSRYIYTKHALLLLQCNAWGESTAFFFTCD